MRVAKVSDLNGSHFAFRSSSKFVGREHTTIPQGMIVAIEQQHVDEMVVRHSKVSYYYFLTR